MQQLLLFKEEDFLIQEIQNVKTQCDKIRKGQYAKISELSKQVSELQEDLNFLKSAICKNEIPHSFFNVS